MGLIGHKLAFSCKLGVLGFEAVDAVLNLRPERPDQSLHGPGRGIAERTNCVALNLVGEFLQHVDLREVSVAQLHALEHVNHPACAFTAGRALAARLVLVELG